MPAKYCVPKARNTKSETNPTGARRPMRVAHEEEDTGRPAR